MCFNELSPHIFNFIKNNFRNKMYCSYEKHTYQDDITDITKLDFISTEINKLDILNIKLGKYIYILKFNT